MRATPLGARIWRPRRESRLAIGALYVATVIGWITAPFLQDVDPETFAWTVPFLAFGAFVVWKALAGRPWARELTLVYSGLGVLGVLTLLTLEPGRELAWASQAVLVALSLITFWVVKGDKPIPLASLQAEENRS